MKFSQLAWQKNEHNYAKILNHPFNQELSQGTLEKDKFMYYIEQDSIYLKEYAKSLATIASRLELTEHILEFIDFAKGAFIAEQEVVHSSFRKQFGEIPAIDKSISNACIGYTSYLNATAKGEAVEVGVAAVLPCFWVYHQVGCHIHKYSAEGNPYQLWIDNYASSEFEAGVRRAITIADELYATASEGTKQKMLEAFTNSVIWEYHFWNDSYKRNYFGQLY